MNVTSVHARTVKSAAQRKLVVSGKSFDVQKYNSIDVNGIRYGVVIKCIHTVADINRGTMCFPAIRVPTVMNLRRCVNNIIQDDSYQTVFNSTQEIKTQTSTFLKNWC